MNFQLFLFAICMAIFSIAQVKAYTCYEADIIIYGAKGWAFKDICNREPECQFIDGVGCREK